MKMRPWSRVFLVAAGLFLAACGGKREASAPETPAASAQSAPPFYYDMGSPTVDVSGYPENQKENYRLFLGVCGSCHTAARPLNSPYVETDIWKRYVRGMHLKMEIRGVRLSEADAGRIVDFLTYDARIRKVEKKKEFTASQEELKKRFKKKA